MEYLKITLTSISLKCNPWTGKYEHSIFSSIREMYDNTDSQNYYNVIVKRNLFGVREVGSSKKIFVLENIDNQLLEESLSNLQSLLNDNGKIFFVCRSQLEQKEYPTVDELISYLDNFSTSFLANSLDYKVNKSVEPLKENSKIKVMIKKYKDKWIK